MGFVMGINTLGYFNRRSGALDLAAKRDTIPELRKFMRLGVTSSLISYHTQIKRDKPAFKIDTW